MSAPPYMKLYIADYLADTTHLNRSEHGAYLLLLMALWRAGGRLPRDPSKLARIAQCTPAEWEEIGPIVLEFFKVSGGSITQKRASHEIAKYQGVVKGSKTAGKASAAKRANKNSPKTPTDVEERLNENPTNHNQNHNQKKNTPLAPKGAEGDEAKAKPEMVTDAQVEEVWAIAPSESRRRSSKADLRRSLVSATRRGRDLDEVTAGLRAYFASPEATKDGGAFVKGVHRMIEQDRWTSFVDAGPAPTAPKVAFDGPPALRERLVTATSEEFVRSFVDHAHWDQASRTLVAKTTVAAERIADECEAALRRCEVRVIPPGAKLPPPVQTRSITSAPGRLPLEHGAAR